MPYSLKLKCLQKTQAYPAGTSSIFGCHFSSKSWLLSLHRIAQFRYNKFRIINLLLALCVFFSCEDESATSQIPYISFPDIVVNLKSQQFLPLQSRGYVTLQQGAAKGLILFKPRFSTKYTAYDRNCSYRPDDACAQVEVAPSGLSLNCNCCLSTFDLSQGFPTGGPAKDQLRKYQTSLNGDWLTITDEPVN